MGIIILLLLSSIVIAGIFLGGFLWALKSGQYDDIEGPAVRILFDDATIDDKDEESEQN